MKYYFYYWKAWNGLSKTDILTEDYCFILLSPQIGNEMDLQNCF